MEKQKKIYCGSGKKKSESWLQVSINPEKFSQYIQEYNGSKFLKLNINIKNEPDRYGKDIEVSIDTWKPTKNGSKQNDNYGEIRSNESSYKKDSEISGDLPF